MPSSADRSTPGAGRPVIIGAGQTTHRDGDPVEPLELLAGAARAALDDAGVAPGAVTSVSVVNVISWAYDDIAARLADRLGAAPAHAGESPPGGDQPTRLVVDAGRRAVGGGGVHLVVGGEALRSVGRAMASGVASTWPSPPPGAGPPDARDFVSADSLRHGLVLPPSVYPLYEHGLRNALGQTRKEATAWSAEMWARLSVTASGQPGAWLPAPVTAERVATVDDGNRMVYDPYPKLMNALLSVDQAAAVVVTDDATARSSGVPEERWIHLWNGAGANDTGDVLARVAFDRSPAMSRTLDDALRVAGVDGGRDDVAAVELYSCFPCVPKLAITHLGWRHDTDFSVTGGLTFFGGPANAYMVCALAAMVATLRDRDDDRPALLYGQGEFVTKHHALVVGRRPRPAGALPPDDEPARQAEVDALVSPPRSPAPRGAGVVETFTVEFGRDGAPVRAIVVGRLDDGRRFVAHDDDRDDIGELLDDGHEPIGLAGAAEPGGDGAPNRFRLS